MLVLTMILFVIQCAYGKPSSWWIVGLPLAASILHYCIEEISNGISQARYEKWKAQQDKSN